MFRKLMHKQHTGKTKNRKSAKQKIPPTVLTKEMQHQDTL